MDSLYNVDPTHPGAKNGDDPAGGAPIMGAVSVTEARRGYEFALSATLRASTVRERTQRLDTYLRWCSGCLPFERETVYAYLRDVRTRCSPMTHLGYFKALRAFFRWCEAERITSDDPMANLPMPRLSAEEKERDAPKYTEADKDTLLSVCKDWTWMGQRDRALVHAAPSARAVRPPGLRSPLGADGDRGAEGAGEGRPGLPFSTRAGAG